MSGSWSPAADAYITMTAGNAGAVGTGAYTMALLVRPASGNNNCGMLQARTNSASVRSLLEDTLKLFGEGDFSSGYGTLTQDTWYVIAETKPAGSANYRMHYWAYAADGSGSFSHGVASGAGNHGDGSTVTQIRIGHAGNRGNGLIAVVGMWDVELSDSQIDTLKSANLSAWSALSPDELLSLENWDGVNAIDTKVGTSSFSSLTGTVSTGSNPPSFNFNLSTTVTGTAAGTVGGLTGTATGVRTVLGTASGTVGGLSGTATGVRTVTGVAAGTVGGLSGTATGLRTVIGMASGTVGGLAGSAAGTRTVLGTAAGTVGGIVGHAAVGADTPGIHVATLTGPTLTPSASGARLTASRTASVLTPN